MDIKGSNLKTLINERGRNNNLDALRLFAAIFVILYHCSITGNYEFGALGVWIFFIISGFLITQSYFNNPNPTRFVWSRLLRIIPALIIMLLITFILTRKSFNDLWNWNVPLWSIPHELLLYGLVLILGASGLMFKNRIVALQIFLASLITALFVKMPHVYVWQVDLSLIPTLLCFFSFGVVAYLYKEYIYISKPILLGVAVITGLSAFILRNTGIPFPLISIPLGYTILYVGYNIDKGLSVVTRYGDFSYGLYIWGFVVQSVIMNYFKLGINPFILFAMTLPISYVIAALSWHLIEKRMLKLKNIKLRALAYGH